MGGEMSFSADRGGGSAATAALEDAGCFMVRTLGYLEWMAIIIAAFTGLVLWLLLTTPLGGNA
jgi:hypothetical protein